MKPFNPRPYQQVGIDLLTREPHAGLFLPPGMGKTGTVLQTFINDLEVDTLLVFGPNRVVSVAWPEEIDKWSTFSHLKYSLVQGDIRKREKALKTEADVYLINVEFLSFVRNMEMLIDFLAAHPRIMLVMDESTAFKTPSSARTTMMRKVASAQPIKRSVILTGTPVPRSIEGVWSQVNMLDKGERLGKHVTEFRRQYMMPKIIYTAHGTVTDWEPAPDSLERVTESISDIILQLNADDWLQLPDYVYHYVDVELPPKAREQYDTIESEFILEVNESTIYSANAAANLSRLRQIANGALYVDENKAVVEELHGAKLDAVQGIINELDGNPCLLVYQFRHDLDRLRGRLGDIPTLSGANASRSRSLVQQFNAGELPILAGHPASMGHGLNLQEGGACNMIWFGQTFDLEHWLQTIDRLRRQGNTAPSVNYHIIRAKDTVDTTVTESLRDKDDFQNLFKRLIDEASHRARHTA